MQLIDYHSKHGKQIRCKIKAETGPWEGGAINSSSFQAYIGCKIKAEPGLWKGVQLIHHHSKHIEFNLKLLF